MQRYVSAIDMRTVCTCSCMINVYIYLPCIVYEDKKLQVQGRCVVVVLVGRIFVPLCRRVIRFGCASVFVPIIVGC